MSTPKKVLILIVVAILVVVILTATGVISNDAVSPSTVHVPDDTPYVSPPQVSNEIVKGYFRTGNCGAGIENQEVPAPSLEACRELGKTMNGVVAVGFRNSNHTSEHLKNTCFFYTCIAPDYDKNDPFNDADIYHTMSCVNDAANFEECV